MCYLCFICRFIQFIVWPVAQLQDSYQLYSWLLCVCFTFNQHEKSHSANNKNPKPQQQLLLNENKNTNKYQSLFSQSFYFNLTKRCTYIFSSFLLELMLERTICFINHLKGKKTINKLVPHPKIKPYTAFQHCI